MQLSVAYKGTLASFGFVGINGSGWAAESHTPQNKSYGDLDLGGAGGVVTYPFNHLCGTGDEYESDLRFWVAGSDKDRDFIDVHLSCTPTEFTKVQVVN